MTHAVVISVEMHNAAAAQDRVITYQLKIWEIQFEFGDSIFVCFNVSKVSHVSMLRVRAPVCLSMGIIMTFKGKAPVCGIGKVPKFMYVKSMCSIRC